MSSLLASVIEKLLLGQAIMFEKILATILALFGLMVMGATIPCIQWMWKHVNGLEHKLAHFSFASIVFIMGVVSLLVSWRLFRGPR